MLYFTFSSLMLLQPSCTSLLRYLLTKKALRPSGGLRITRFSVCS